MNKMIMLVGLPGAGKSYVAQDLAERYDAKIFSSDTLREELYNDINDQEHNCEVFAELHKRIKECLSSGRNAVYDSCNINYQRRMAFLQELKNISCEKICTLVAVPYEECLRRNAERERKVPDSVIKRMYMNFNIPATYEGWDDIKVVFNSDLIDVINYELVSNYSLIKRLDKYDQGNSHHTLTLGKHLTKAYEYCIEHGCNLNTRLAALFHDVSKPFCRTNLNAKGEEDGETHYFGHQYCSAYDSLFYNHKIEGTDILEIAVRIMWHMQPYFNKEEKTIVKYRKLWGEDLYNDICSIHEADLAAH